MIQRRLENIVLSTLAETPSVALIGPRQVGKTTLAFEISKSIPSVYLDLESRSDIQKVEDIELFHRANRDKLIILDEVQRVPEIFNSIRGLIDSERRKGNKTGHFLFLGSASIDLLRQSSESLAGRISYVELFPIDALEFLNMPTNIHDLNDLWVRGGFPESLLAGDKSSLKWRIDFIKTYLERDIPLLGPRIPAATLERFWTMLAHSQGTNLNASKLASALEVSSVSVSRYIDLFVDLLLIRKLMPYTANIKKRLIKSPRIYVRDSGINHALLNIQSYNDLLGHPVVGKSWEGFVMENIVSLLPNWSQAYYYRTAGGAEIDLVLEFGPDEKWAIEIKRGVTFNLSRGFHEACVDLNPTKKFVIHGGQDRFELPNGIAAISLYEFMTLLKTEK